MIGYEYRFELRLMPMYERAVCCAHQEPTESQIAKLRDLLMQSPLKYINTDAA